MQQWPQLHVDAAGVCPRLPGADLQLDTAGACVSCLVLLEPWRQGQPPVPCVGPVGGEGASHVPGFLCLKSTHLGSFSRL